MKKIPEKSSTDEIDLQLLIHFEEEISKYTNLSIGIEKTKSRFLELAKNSLGEEGLYSENRFKYLLNETSSVIKDFQYESLQQYFKFYKSESENKRFMQLNVLAEIFSDIEKFILDAINGDENKIHVLNLIYNKLENE